MNLFMLSILAIACEKGHENHHTQTLLNINYPAAYVVNGESNTISVIQLQNEKITETIDLHGAKFPHHIYLSPDKALMAVAITGVDLSGGHGGHGSSVGGYKVLIINTTTGAIIKEISLEKMPHNALFNAQGSELWLGQSAEGKSEIWVYSTSDWSRIAKIEVGSGLSEITLSADGKYFFAANTDDGNVSKIDPNSKTVLNLISTGSLPVGVWPGTDKFSYADNEGSRTVSEIDIEQGVVSSSINLGFKPGYVAYYAPTNELWVSDASNGKVAYYTKQDSIWVSKGEIVTGPDAHAIAFNTDYSKALITNQGNGTISIIDPINHTVLKTISVGLKPNGLIIKE